MAASSASLHRSSLSPPSSSSPLQRLSTFKDTTNNNPSSSSLDSTTTTSTNPLSSFSSDPIFSLFLSPDFSSTSFSSQALSSGSAASTAERLQDGIRLLEKQLRSEVLSHHDHLFSQLSSLRDADSALSLVRSSVFSLQSSVRRVRSEISDPHTQIKSKTTQLSNLHTASQHLQFTIKVLRLIKKLRDLMEGSSESLDLLKGAQLHCEILGLANDNDLGGIDVVDEELRWVSEAGSKLRAEGMKMLEGGLEGLNQAEVGSGLQVFYNLGELRGTVDGLVAKYKNLGVKSIANALDMKAISAASGAGGGFGGPGGIQRSGTPQIGGGARAKDALWQRMSGCMDQLHSIIGAVWLLQRVLSKKRDPFTHVLLLDEVIQEGDPMLTDRVWEAFVKSFTNQMKSAFTASSFVKEIFTLGYPKLYSMIENLLERVSRETDVKGVLPAISSDNKEQMRGAIEIFRTAFLTLCLSRLSDLVNSVLPVSNRGSVPSKEHISKIISRIQEEIQAVQFDGHLTLLVLREIGKVLILLAERAEYQISTGPEARQITGPATPAQLKNFMLCQHLQEIHTRISASLSKLPREASEVLSPSLGAVYAVACDSVESLFQAMLDRLQSCILQIHDHNFGVVGMDAAMDNNASPYMEDLQKCILHFRREFLSRLLPSSKTAAVTGTESISTKLARGMASRVLMFFIRHASLVRPLSESGKLRMARDMAELELAVGQNLFPVEQLGAPYRALRAFRPVIFLDTSQLEASPLLQDLRPSTILHHLYSRGPDELLSPMQRNKLTPLQYSLWLDSQGEDQIWRGIKATLDDYATLVRSRGDKEFDPVYPIMLRIGSSISENSSQSET
ncbi:conserved oligomeric Golgi complex subunit 5-like [Chenopodium quinoa]|nr:conserved oligomeric Golgi complex subunit 5-like [Chenopodium quinoa]